MIINPNQSQTLFLPAGHILTLANASGSAGLAVRLSRVPGGGDSQSVTALSGSDVTFGPYSAPERFNVSCTAGAVTATMASVDPATISYDDEAAALLNGKVNHALATATSDFLVGNTGGGSWIKKTLAEVKSILGLSSYGLIGHGGFYAYDKAATLTLAINTQSVYHVAHNITNSPADIVTGLCSGFTFNRGRVVAADALNIKNGAGGLLQIETSDAHLLTTGDIVSITKENRVAGHNKIVKVTVVDATNFLCDGVTYAGGTQTTTAIIDEPAYLRCGSSAAGVYFAAFSIAFTGTAEKIFRSELNVGLTPADNVAGQRASSGFLDTMTVTGNVNIAAQDRVFISAMNMSGVEDIVITHMNLNLHRIG